MADIARGRRRAWRGCCDGNGDGVGGDSGGRRRWRRWRRRWLRHCASRPVGSRSLAVAAAAGGGGGGAARHGADEGVAEGGAGGPVRVQARQRRSVPGEERPSHRRQPHVQCLPPPGPWEGEDGGWGVNTLAKNGREWQPGVPQGPKPYGQGSGEGGGRQITQAMKGGGWEWSVAKR